MPLTCLFVFGPHTIMPYKYIGRTTDFKGKTLWEILGNLKNFGVGRIIARSKFEGYSEPSYVKILKVETLPDPEVKSMDVVRKVKVWVEKTFRGSTYPDVHIIAGASYKTDYRLIPRDEEKAYCEHAEPKVRGKILPRTMAFPPLMREIILKEMRARGEPVTKEPEMEVAYRQGRDNTYRIAKEDEVPTVEISSNLGTPVAPRLYKGIKL